MKVKFSTNQTELRAKMLFKADYPSRTEYVKAITKALFNYRRFQATKIK